ncbi:penicillin-binding transpeptidase domain-containing protein [Arthrobacter sp. Br18]|uniref:penicillin-binding transpeptidase domain-containing protein n=1 Tax=Arthrobacter sp. Br18 TaxID=1312954 RepID=UPI00047C19E9|nr:penicillin-binding transpeptidase domain-containing protein [Arthrobacter sp. Br18]
MGNLRRVNAVVGTAVLAATLSGCTTSGPTAEDAARELADGLALLDVSGSAFTAEEAQDVTTDLGTITEALDPLRPQVAVASVESTGDDAATARLNYTWDVDASDVDWTYSTTAQLMRVDDEWQAVWDPALLVPELQVDERLTMATTQAERAGITGAGGEAIVTERPVVRVGIDKMQVPEPEQPAAATALAELVGIDPAAYTEQVAAAGAEAFVEAIVLRDDASRTVTDEQIEAIPGTLVQADTLALGPTRTFARELLGSVGQPSAEQIESSEGALTAGEIAGLSGLQLQHNDQLAGTPGLEISAMPSDGAGPRQLFEKAPVEGTPLAITLEPALQTLAEQVLAEEPSASSIVALRPSSGEILTVANGPGSEGLQTALLGQYPPGSTFKVATSLALLREGFTPETPTECSAELTVEGRAFTNASTYPAQFVGTIPLLQTFAQSCNTGFISNRDIVSQPELAAAAADLGIGVESAVGLPAFFGAVPAEAEGTAHAAAMIGQGEVLVSPLALATMAASVGNGARVTPTLLAAGQDEGQPPSSSAPPSPSGTPGDAPAPSSLTPEEAATLRTLMAAVVAEGGAQLLSDIPGEPVLAKTGTAEFGSEDPPRTHAWIVALQGDLAVAVFVEEGELGSTSGGPLLEAFLRGAAG